MENESCMESVKKLREAMGLNRRQFCAYFNIPYRTVTDWEGGKRQMPDYLYELMVYKATSEQMISK